MLDQSLRDTQTVVLNGDWLDQIYIVGYFFYSTMVLAQFLRDSQIGALRND